MFFVLSQRGIRSRIPQTDANLRLLFPHLPERTRLFRLFARNWPLAQRFPASADTGLIADNLGMKRIHPRGVYESASTGQAIAIV